MKNITIDYRKDLLERLQDEEYAAAYLNAVLTDGDPKAFLIALKDVADARSYGMAQLAKKAHLNRETLYHHIISARKSPTQ